MKKKPHYFATGLLWLFSAGSVFALETGALLSLEAENADNINQSNVAPVSDTTVTSTARLNVGHNGPMLSLTGIGVGSYVEFLDNTFDSRWLLTSDIAATWFLSRSMTWVARNQTNQTRIDPFANDVPTNIENQNLFNTGPEFISELGSATRFTLGANYGLNTFSISGTDNERISAYTQLRRTVRRPLALSLNARAQTVEFDDDVNNQNFDSADAFFRFEWVRAAFSLRGDFGVTRLELAGGIPTTEPLTELFAQYVQQSGGVVTLLYRNALGDSTSDFDNGLFAVNDDQDNTQDADLNFAGGGVYIDQQTRVNWSKPLGRVSGNANAFYRDRDFLTTNFDQVNYGVGASLNFVLNSRWTLGVFGSYDQTDFQANARVDESMTAGLRMTRNFGRKFLLFGQAFYLDRESTDPISTFDDLRFAIGLQYQIGAQPTVRTRRGQQSGLSSGI